MRASNLTGYEPGSVALDSSGWLKKIPTAIENYCWHKYILRDGAARSFLIRRVRV